MSREQMIQALYEMGYSRKSLEYMSDKGIQWLYEDELKNN